MRQAMHLVDLRRQKQLADIGFQRIELCSPVGYASSGFASVGKYKGAELRKVLGDAGVQCHSSHFSMKELRDNLGAMPLDELLRQVREAAHLSAASRDRLTLGRMMMAGTRRTNEKEEGRGVRSGLPRTVAAASRHMPQ